MTKIIYIMAFLFGKFCGYQSNNIIAIVAATVTVAVAVLLFGLLWINRMSAPVGGGGSRHGLPYSSTLIFVFFLVVWCLVTKQKFNIY